MPSNSSIITIITSDQSLKFLHYGIRLHQRSPRLNFLMVILFQILAWIRMLFTLESTLLTKKLNTAPGTQSKVLMESSMFQLLTITILTPIETPLVPLLSHLKFTVNTKHITITTSTTPRATLNLMPKPTSKLDQTQSVDPEVAQFPRG